MSKSINPVIVEIFRQYNRVTGFAHQIKFQGRKFNLKYRLADQEDEKKLTAMFKFCARKRKGAIFGDQIVLNVTYNWGTDLYDWKIQFVNGTTLDDSVIYEAKGCYADMFDMMLELDAIVEEYQKAS